MQSAAVTEFITKALAVSELVSASGVNPSELKDLAQLRDAVRKVVPPSGALAFTRPAKRFIPTERGGFVDTAEAYLSADGTFLELIEWSEDLGKHTFAAAQEAAAKLGAEWAVASPKDWTTLLDYDKEGPATDAPIVNEWHWTNKKDASSPSDNAVCVGMHFGHVGWLGQDSNGRVRACRRVRASQYSAFGA